MEVIIMPTAEKASELAARIIADAVKAKPAYTLGLATGRTMERLYSFLAAWHKSEGLDFSLCKSFNLDEYVGFDGSNKDSYRYYMNFHLFDKINIDKRNTFVPTAWLKIWKLPLQNTKNRWKHAAAWICSCSVSAEPVTSASTNPFPPLLPAPAR